MSDTKGNELLIYPKDNKPKLKSIFLLRAVSFQLCQDYFLNEDIVATIKDAVKDIEKEETDTFCAKASLTLQNTKIPKYYFSKNERKALKDLQLDTSIVILPAD